MDDAAMMSDELLAILAERQVIPRDTLELVLIASATSPEIRMLYMAPLCPRPPEDDAAVMSPSDLWAILHDRQLDVPLTTEIKLVLRRGDPAMVRYTALMSKGQARRLFGD